MPFFISFKMWSFGRASLVLAVLLQSLASAHQGHEWGNLQGRFVYSKAPPKATTIEVTKNQAVFGPETPDESLLIHQQNRGVANILVFLHIKRGNELSIHQSYKESTENKSILHMRSGRFEPRVLLVQTSQQLELINEDKGLVSYAPMIHTFKNLGLKSLPPTDKPILIRFKNPEGTPCQVNCAIHPWMKSFILIRDNPYMAKTNSEGYFRIENLPVGTHTFCLWHEKVGMLKDISVGKRKSNSKGRITVTIREGENKLKDVRLGQNILRSKF